MIINFALYKKTKVQYYCQIIISFTISCSCSLLTVGKAIAAVITLAALQNQGKTHDNLEKIASQATKFLILGKPGGGKTTTLLELAEALIERAEGDSDAPIPVILELSTWQEVTKRKFLPFGEREKYDPSIHCLDIKLFWQSVSYREYSIC
jgi:hypothetical protein